MTPLNLTAFPQRPSQNSKIKLNFYPLTRDMSFGGDIQTTVTSMRSRGAASALTRQIAESSEAI